MKKLKEIIDVVIKDTISKTYYIFYFENNKNIIRYKAYNKINQSALTKCVRHYSTNFRKEKENLKITGRF